MGHCLWAYTTARSRSKWLGSLPLPSSMGSHSGPVLLLGLKAHAFDLSLLLGLPVPLPISEFVPTVPKEMPTALLTPHWIWGSWHLPVPLEYPFPHMDPRDSGPLWPTIESYMPNAISYSSRSYKDTLILCSSRIKANTAHQSDTLNCIFRKNLCTINIILWKW